MHTKSKDSTNALSSLVPNLMAPKAHSINITNSNILKSMSHFPMYNLSLDKKVKAPLLTKNNSLMTSETQILKLTAF
jgi:hypothetical protein